MITIIRNTLILVSPFLLMFTINYLYYLSNSKCLYVKKGFYVLNPATKDKNSCTWACHNKTTFCKDNHVKHMKSYLDDSDVPYYFIINGLKSTGNYVYANILILVLVIPILIWFFIIKTLSLQQKINQLK